MDANVSMLLLLLPASRREIGRDVAGTNYHGAEFEHIVTREFLTKLFSGANDLAMLDSRTAVKFCRLFQV